MFLFAIAEPELLTATIRRLLADDEVERWVSVVSLWEIAIKVQIGKLPMPLDQAFYMRHLQALKAQTLAVSLQHSLAFMALPLHHRDPFDLLLISQATEEGMTLVTETPPLSPTESQQSGNGSDWYLGNMSASALSPKPESPAMSNTAMTLVFGFFMLASLALPAVAQGTASPTAADVQASASKLVRLHEAWGPGANPPHTSLSLKEISREGPVIKFRLYETGLPKDGVYTLLQWPVTQGEPSPVMRGVTFDKTGLAICAGIFGHLRKARQTQRSDQPCLATGPRRAFAPSLNFLRSNP